MGAKKCPGAKEEGYHGDIFAEFHSMAYSTVGRYRCRYADHDSE